MPQVTKEYAAGQIMAEAERKMRECAHCVAADTSGNSYAEPGYSVCWQCATDAISYAIRAALDADV